MRAPAALSSATICSGTGGARVAKRERGLRDRADRPRAWRPEPAPGPLRPIRSAARGRARGRAPTPRNGARSLADVRIMAEAQPAILADHRGDRPHPAHQIAPPCRRGGDRDHPKAGISEAARAHRKRRPAGAPRRSRCRRHRSAQSGSSRAVRPGIARTVASRAYACRREILSLDMPLVLAHAHM